FAALNAVCTAAPTRCTGIDYSNTSNDIIPRNFGQALGSLSVNIRISRTFGFGGEANRSASSGQSGQKTATETAKRGEGAGTGRGGPMIAGGGLGSGGKGPGGPAGGGPAGGGMGDMMRGGPGGGAGGASKYTLTLSVNFQNLLNRVNLGSPVGNLTSPFFGQSVSVAGSFGGFGGPGGGFGGGGSGAGNRRVTLSARFSF